MGRDYVTVYLLDFNDKNIGVSNCAVVPRVGEYLKIRTNNNTTMKFYEVLKVEHDFHTVLEGLIPSPDSHYVFLQVREVKV